MELIYINECPACGSQQTLPFQRYNSFPAIIFPVDEGSSTSVENRPLSARICKSCQHIFLDELDTLFIKSVYDKYYINYPYKDLESMQSSYRMPFEGMIDSCVDLQEYRTLLEIGSDSVRQLEYFISRGISCTAINPQATSDNKVRFIDGYYGEYELNETFDLIISRFNLEHILDPRMYFKSILHNSHKNTKVFLQVPNIEYFINSGMLNILAHEHVHYFNILSLQRMLNRYGFRIIFCSESSAPSIMCAAVPFSNNTTAYTGYVQQIRTLVDNITSVLMEYDSGIVIYGASLSLSSLLYNDSNIKSMLDKVTIVDDNPFVQGKCMPGTDKAIVGINQIDLVKTQVFLLLLNEVYHDRIITSLKDLGYKGLILSLTHQKLKRFS